MFPNIYNNLGLSSVKKYLDLRSKNVPPTNCLLEALELCLTCNSSIFNNENYLQIDDTAQGPHMSCDLMQTLLWQILIREPQNIISDPPRRRGLGMTFLYFGCMVLFLKSWS